MHVCICMHHMEVRRESDPWNYSYRWLWATTWTLETKPGPSARAIKNHSSYRPVGHLQWQNQVTFMIPQHYDYLSRTQKTIHTHIHAWSYSPLADKTPHKSHRLTNCSPRHEKLLFKLLIKMVQDTPQTAQVIAFVPSCLPKLRVSEALLLKAPDTWDTGLGKAELELTRKSPWILASTVPEGVIQAAKGGKQPIVLSRLRTTTMASMITCP